MSTVGVQVSVTEVPGATSNLRNTANAFVVGLGDWGAASGVNTPVAATSISQVASTIGPRSGTNATLYDSLDAFFREGGSTAYIGRVVGPSPVNASGTFAPSTAVTFTAIYPGNYGNAIQVTIQNNTTNVVITLTDTFGNTLATSPQLTTLAAVVSWAATTGYVTATTTGSTLPSTVAATALTGGTDNRGSATLTSWTNALNNFSATLGPGQVFAPGESDWGTGPLVGITAALGQHALNNNRVAIVDLPDNTTASALITDIGSTYNNVGSGPIGFWAGNLTIPGVVGGTTRTIPPSPVIAALCARGDAGGNPNTAAAGVNFPLQYVTGPASIVSGNGATYGESDLNTLNSAGINTFAVRSGQLFNYGFVSSLLSTTDGIRWQFNHDRMLMALQSDAQALGEPFVFSQLDGQGGDQLAFNTALSARLLSYYRLGALFGDTATDAFAVNTGSSVNTPTTLQAGQLNANVAVRLSPFAQLVSIVLNAVPITQSVPSVTP
jgi:hypothetical protein